MSEPRILCWFSCGAASAVASKISIEIFKPQPVTIVNCDTRNSEHPDNYRFSEECEKWFGQPITYIRSSDYTSVDDVVEKTRWMSGPKGARCTTELKKLPRLNFAHPDDIHVFGFHYGEQQRAFEFKERNPELHLRWVLIEQEISKSECYRMLKSAGIGLPVMYSLGFDNNNCPGCLKATSAWYWDMVRRNFPLVFKKRCEQSRLLGVRLVQYRNKRIFLDELPPGPFKKKRRGENMSCGPECGIQTTMFSKRTITI